ncbi:MAG: YbjN domain-containing protein [Terrimicrobiaceae bacterium]
MNDEPIPNAATEQPLTPHPLDVMRQVFRDAEFHFDDEDSRLFLRLKLECVDVSIVCWGNPNDVATLIVTLPVRATPDFRPQVGEFLHRLNYDSKRKFWEMDYNDGEIRLAAYLDTILGPLTPGLFQALLHYLVKTADTVFPYLTSVLSGRMTPEFAADQAEAAIQALSNKQDISEDERASDEN